MKALSIAVALALAPGAASAAGFYLVLIPEVSTRTSLVLPDRYPTRDECKHAGRVWKGENRDNRFVCIPAP